MDIKHISGDYYVSPQIAPEDFATLKAEGFERVICNRPDMEIPPVLHAAEMATAAKAAGLAFDVVPLTRETLTPDNAQHQNAFASGGKTLAYCASGTRSTMIWAIAQAGKRPTDEILQDAANAGYDLSGMAGFLDALAGN